ALQAGLRLLPLLRRLRRSPQGHPRLRADLGSEAAQGAGRPGAQGTSRRGGVGLSLAARAAHWRVEKSEGLQDPSRRLHLGARRLRGGLKRFPSSSVVSARPPWWAPACRGPAFPPCISPAVPVSSSAR